MPRFFMSSPIVEPPAGPPRSEARAALALAINQRREAEGVVSRARAVMAESGERVWTAKDALRAARSAVVELRANGASRADITAAMAREASAGRDVEAAKVAHEVLEDATAGLERELTRAERAAEREGRAILASEAGRLLEEVAKAGELFVRKVAGLSVVEGAVNPFEGGELHTEIRGALARAKHDDLEAMARRHPAAAEWRAALAALLLDADARLPPD